MTSARGTYIRDLLNKVEAANQPGRGSGAMGHSRAAEVALLAALVEKVEQLEALTEGACFQNPSPSVLYEQRGMQCGLVHDFNWSEWRQYEHDGRAYEGRWCLTCGTTQVRAALPGGSDHDA